MFRIPTLATLGFGEGARTPAVAPPPPKLDFAPLFAEHCRAVATLDAAIHPSAWTEARFQKSTPQYGRLGMVALLEGTARVVGYTVSAIDLETSTLRVLRFGVAPEFARRRVGARMFLRLFDDCEDDGLRAIEVPAPEHASEPRKFLVAMGFRGSHVLPDYFPSGDAWVFRKRIDTGMCMGK